MIVTNVFLDGGSEHLFAEEDHSAQALFLDRPYKSLSEGFQVGAMRRQANGLDAGGLQDLAELPCELGIAVQEQVRLPVQ